MKKLLFLFFSIIVHIQHYFIWVSGIQHSDQTTIHSTLQSVSCDTSNTHLLPHTGKTFVCIKQLFIENLLYYSCYGHITEVDYMFSVQSNHKKHEERKLYT